MPKKIIQFSLPANLDFAGAVRRFSNCTFRTIGFAEAWANRLELVVDELFMNAVMYGSDENSNLYISFDYDQKEVSFTIQDEGKGSKKATPEDVKAIVQKNGANHSVAKTSGRGLAMIADLWTDHFEIKQSEYGGIMVRFVKKIDATDPPDLPPESKQSSSNTTSSSPLIGVGTALIVESGTSLPSIESLALEVQAKIQNLSSGDELALDLSQVDYINSTLIGYIASWYNDIQAKGSKLRLKNVNEAVKDVLTLVGLGQLFSLDQ